MKSPVAPKRSPRRKEGSRYNRYSAKYDAHYDSRTGRWLEAKCDDVYACPYCLGRPERFPITQKPS